MARTHFSIFSRLASASLCACCLLAANASLAQVHKGPLVRYGAGAKGEGRQVVAIVNIEEVMRDCEQEFAVLEVEKLDFKGASTQIIGFRAVDSNRNRHYVSLSPDLQDQLSNADRGAVANLLREKSRHMVTLQRCGSGGYLSARDIYRLPGNTKPSSR